MEKHVAAFSLRKEGASYTEISKVLKVHANTVTRWAEKYRWEDKIMEQQQFQDSSLEYVRGLIHHNLKVLDAIKERMLNEHDIETASVEDLKKMLTNKGDVDALNKLYVNIRGKEMTWDMIVRIMNEWIQYMEHEDYAMAQKLADYVNDFLDQKRRSA